MREGVFSCGRRVFLLLGEKCQLEDAAGPGETEASVFDMTALRQGAGRDESCVVWKTDPSSRKQAPEDMVRNFFCVCVSPNPPRRRTREVLEHGYCGIELECYISSNDWCFYFKVMK